MVATNMKSILTPCDKSFLLAEEEPAFDALYGREAAFKLPASWKDFFLHVDKLDLTQVSDLFIEQ